MSKTAEEIIIKVANEHSYESWGEMMYDTHEHSQIEYTKQAMHEYSNQFKEKIASDAWDAGCSWFNQGLKSGENNFPDKETYLKSQLK